MENGELEERRFEDVTVVYGTNEKAVNEAELVN
jgi:hypothetical protein